MTIGEACHINTLLQALTNEEDGPSWEDMEKAGRSLAQRAHKVLGAGHDPASFSRALAVGQGLRNQQGPRKPRGAA